MSTTVTWQDGQRPLSCKVCGTPSDAALLGLVNAPGEDAIEIVRCPACGSIDLVDEARDSSPNDATVDAYLEGGVGLGVIAATLVAVPPGRVKRFLDVGCNFGFSLDLGRFAFGWDVLGVEPSMAAARGSQELGVTILQEYLTDETPIDQPFDLVLASEVIEHVPEPQRFAEMLRRRLTPTGTVLLTTPAAEIVSPDEPAAEVLSALSPWYHTVLASRQGLHDLLIRAGFAFVDVVRQRGTLLALASNDPEALPPTWERGTTPAFLEDYYAARARSAAPGSALAGGMAVRWLRALTSRGAFAEAEDAIPLVTSMFRARHDIDLDDPEALLADPAALPHLAGAAFAIGMTCLLHREDAARAATCFELAGAAVEAWAAHHSPLDLDSIDLRFQAGAHRAIALARVRPTEASTLALSLGDLVDTSTLAGRDRVAALQCRVLVEIVARGALEETGDLADVVARTAPRLVHGDPAARTAALDALFSLGIRSLNTGDAVAARSWFTHAALAAEQQPADDAHAAALAASARHHITLAVAQGAVDEPTPALHPAGVAHHALDVYWCDASGVYLEGWAHAGAVPVSGVSVQVGDVTVAADPRPRLDLLNHWPDLPDVTSAGFAAYVPASPHSPITLHLHTGQGDHVVPLELPGHTLPFRADEPQRADEVIARMVAVAPPGPVLALGFRADSSEVLDTRLAALGGREVVTVDIHPGLGVDVVADVHRLADAVPHDHFAAVVSASLLEHVAAPWLVAAQISRVLQTGGLSVHVVPWTWPTHAEPNDFWRMSDEGLRQLFGPTTGFEHVDSGFFGPAAVVPSAAWRADSITMPSLGGHSGAWIAARKVDDSAASVDWPLDAAVSAELARRYPLDGLAPAARVLPSVAHDELPAETTIDLAPARASSAAPTVTAIVPVYNGAGYVEAALRSIVGQELLPTEIIVVDDGSSDASAAVAEAFESPVPLRVVRRQNGGQSAARNTAAALAGGELLAFLDQDDLWHRRHLARLVRAYKRSPDVGWAYTDFDEIDHLGRTVTHSYIETAGLSHPHRNLLELLAADLMVLPSASLIRASAFHQVGGFDEDLVGYEDDDLFVRLFRAGWRSAFVREPLTKFRVHPSSSSAGARFRASRLRYLAKLADEVPDDVRMRRYYVRDLVVPRMFQNTLADYSAALQTGDYGLAREIATTVRGVAEFGPMTMRRRRGLMLLDHPRATQAALRINRHLPGPLRRDVNPSLQA
ncbi:glycosyltransferase [Cellulomonas sp. McL0617]|uniref:glycosyltransferase n=1 Tax=Cellulomonas sp. McL0617 TaxID=3415675 RepID=UPI003CF5383D